MNDDFVTYELAVKLKKKGFDYPCIGHYFNNQLYIAHYHNAFHSDKDESVAAPTISQVLKWLRKKKHIYVSILPFATHSTINKVAFYYLIEYNSTGQTMEGIEQNTYCAEWKDAALAGIEYVLDNLI